MLLCGLTGLNPKHIAQIIGTYPKFVRHELNGRNSVKNQLITFKIMIKQILKSGQKVIVHFFSGQELLAVKAVAVF